MPIYRFPRVLDDPRDIRRDCEQFDERDYDDEIDDFDVLDRPDTHDPE